MGFKLFDPLMLPAMYTHEVRLPDNLSPGQQVSLGNIPQLKGKRVIGVTAISSLQADLSPSGAAVFSGEAGSLYLTLIDDSSFEFVNRVPMAQVEALTYFRPPLVFKPKRIKFEQSYILSVDNTQAGTVVPLTFIYEP